MPIVNKTPHNVDVLLADGITISFAPDGEPIRVKTTIAPAGNCEGIPLSLTTFQAASTAPLPPVIPGVIYIVSQIALSAFPERNDFVVPSEVVRDDNGVIIGCKSLGVRA